MPQAFPDFKIIRIIFRPQISHTFRDIYKHFDGYTKIDGVYLLLFAFFASWMTDIFAYFVGSKFGKHKLCPKISPKKTVEGAVGGLVFCVISFVVYALIANKVGGVSINIALIILVGVITSIFSQLGDLAASTVKRAFGIKDYGNLIPGHGGIMDRFDSIIAVSPILLVAQTVFNFIN